MHDMHRSGVGIPGRRDGDRPVRLARDEQSVRGADQCAAGESVDREHAPGVGIAGRTHSDPAGRLARKKQSLPRTDQSPAARDRADRVHIARVGPGCRNAEVRRLLRKRCVLQRCHEPKEYRAGRLERSEHCACFHDMHCAHPSVRRRPQQRIKVPRKSSSRIPATGWQVWAVPFAGGIQAFSRSFRPPALANCCHASFAGCQVVRIGCAAPAPVMVLRRARASRW